MDKNSYYFIFSGVCSFFLFFLFLWLFVFMFFTMQKESVYALKKDKFIAVSVVLPKDVALQKESKATFSQKKIKKERKEIDINNLFSDVWTQKISHRKKIKKIDSKRVEDIARKIKTIKKSDKSTLLEKAKSSHSIASEKEQESSSLAEEVNEYLAKIQAIVYQYFHVPPNSEGNVVKTVIELDSLGHMIDFRVLSYSSNSALNEEADRIKERLKNVLFPKNPQKRSSRTIVLLVSKE